MKVALLDDEISVTLLLGDYLKKYSLENGVDFDISVFNDPEKMLSGGLSYDLVLLDVEMPGIDGFAVAKRIREMRGDGVVIMFVTNMAQYAIRGYEVNAVDYILKPISYYDFFLKIKKALRFIEKQADDTIVIKTPSSKIIVNQSDILYVEVVKHYLIFYTKLGEYTMRGSMKEIESRLKSSSFSRCNNSFLINLRHVGMIRDMEVHIDGRVLYMSRARKKDFVNDLSLYLGGI